MPYQNAKERLSMSTLRIGTDVNIHCKLLDCTSPPKNPKIRQKKCQKMSNNFHLSIRTRCAKFFKLTRNIVVRRMKCLYLMTNSILLFKWFFLSPKEGRKKFLEWGGGQVLLKSSKILKFFCEEIFLFSGDDDACSSPIQSFLLCSKKISKEKNGVSGNEEEEVLPAYQRTSYLKKIQYTILKR